MFSTVEDTIQYHSIMPAGKLCEFGVFNGNTLRRLIEGFEKVGYLFDEIYGYDVFVGGLPDETSGVYMNPDWKKGAFDVSVDYNLTSVNEAIEFVRQRVGYEVNYIPGYFCDTLVEDNANRVGKEKISYCHVDCDIHSSSLLVLNYVFRYRLLAVGGIIRFDDILSTPANGGQKLALQQAINKYKFVLSQLSANVFQLINYGD